MADENEVEEAAAPAEAVEDVDESVDEHGLEIQRYESTVLVVVPSEGYSEETLRHARSSLYNVHVGTRTVSTADEELIKGRLQDEFQPDGRLEDEDLDAYAGVVFAGGLGAAGLASDTSAQRLAREALAAGKLLGAWGEAVEVLVRADVVRKRRVTGPRALRGAVRAAGGYYTGNQIERDGALVTGIDDAAGLRFGKLLVQVVAI